MSTLAAYTGDPSEFAIRLSGLLGEDNMPGLLATETAAYASFQAAVRVLQERLPDETGVKGAVTTADEAAHAWAGVAFDAGVRFGVAAEALRRALLDAAS